MAASEKANRYKTGKIGNVYIWFCLRYCVPFAFKISWYPLFLNLEPLKRSFQLLNISWHIQEMFSNTSGKILGFFFTKKPNLLYKATFLWTSQVPAWDSQGISFTYYKLNFVIFHTGVIHTVLLFWTWTNNK